MAGLEKKDEKHRRSSARACKIVSVVLFFALGICCLAWILNSPFSRYLALSNVLAPFIESGLVNTDPNHIISEGPYPFKSGLHARFKLVSDYPSGGIEKVISGNSEWKRVFDVSNESDLLSVNPATISSRNPIWWIQSSAKIDEAVSFSRYRGDWDGIAYVVDDYLYIKLYD